MYFSIRESGSSKCSSVITGECIFYFFCQGYGLLTVQAHFHFLRPTPCKGEALIGNGQCDTASTPQVALLFSGLYLVALGTGGVKAALPALGADQFDERDPKEAMHLSSFFNWFLFSLTIGASIGVTFVVWISSNQGWDWSFGVCTTALFFAIAFVYMGKSSYRNNVPGGSPILRILQVWTIDHVKYCVGLGLGLGPTTLQKKTDTYQPFNDMFRCNEPMVDWKILKLICTWTDWYALADILNSDNTWINTKAQSNGPKILICGWPRSYGQIVQFLCVPILLTTTKNQSTI